MRQRVITAVVALAIFIPILYIGGIAVVLAAAVLAGIGVYELFRMKGLAILSFEGVLAILGQSFGLTSGALAPFLSGNNSNFLLFYLTVMIILGFSVVSKNTYTIDEAGFPVVASLYVGVGFQNLVTARAEGLSILLLRSLLFGQQISVHIWWDVNLANINYGQKFLPIKRLKAL